MYQRNLTKTVPCEILIFSWHLWGPGCFLEWKPLAAVNSPFCFSSRWPYFGRVAPSPWLPYPGIFGCCDMIVSPLDDTGQQPAALIQFLPYLILASALSKKEVLFSLYYLQTFTCVHLTCINLELWKKYPTNTLFMDSSYAKHLKSIKHKLE